MKVKRSYFEKILKINKAIFPYLIGLSFFFSALESYMYIGFLRKFILLDSRFFLTLSLFSIIFIFYLGARDKNYKPAILEDFIINLNALFFIPILIFYWIMTVSNSIKYPNYIFATFHIQPQNFLNISLLSLGLFILKNYKLLNVRNKPKLYRSDSMPFITLINHFFEKIHKETVLLVFLFFFLSIYAIDNFSKTIDQVANGFAFISAHLNYTYSDKMRKYWGFYYDYMEFVKNYTPSDATILIPPQSNHWLSTGNAWLSRYFSYPRYLLHGDVFSIPKDGYDYVLIAKGEWLNNDVDWGWPKVDVKAEEIWYIDPNTLKVTEVKKDFDFTNPFNMQAWGLIKVSKGIQK